MKQEKTNGTTLYDLANMVAKGFESTASDIKELRSDMNARFSVVDKRLGKLDYQIDEVYDILKRFEENDILNFQKRVRILEKTVRSLASQTSKQD